MNSRPAVALLCLVLLAASAAGTARADDPAFVSLSAGWFDFNKSDDQAADFRLEYRHDERFVFDLVKPWAGVEVTSDGALFVGAGVLMDIYIGKRLVLTGTFAPGAWSNGDGRDLGHTLQFRSQAELGYRFNDRSRMAIAISHISNASLGDSNPGVEILSFYFHVPFEKLF